MPSDNPVTPPPDVEFSDEFYEAYSNNIYFESSVWDLKLLFGQLDQTEGKVKIIQHSAITVPWIQAKLMLYWLKAQVGVHELTNGKIHIPKPVIPLPIPELTEEMKKSDPNAEAIHALIVKLRSEFIESLE
jgi:hypothetical protein